jgi:hypothetical protein
MAFDSSKQTSRQPESLDTWDGTGVDGRAPQGGLLRTYGISGCGVMGRQPQRRSLSWHPDFVAVAVGHRAHPSAMLAWQRLLFHREGTALYDLGGVGWPLV